MSTEPVLFYGTSRPYPEFSNFHTAFFELEGKTWPTSEHFYMAQKTTDKDHQEQIRKADSPGKAKRMAGRKGIITLREGWDDMKFEVMVKACRAKFSQNDDLKDLLLSTGARPLHEDCRDPWWGGGPNFPKGRDYLGRVLMQVRDELRGE